MKLAELLETINTKAGEVNALFTKADDNNGEMTEADVAAVKDLNKTIEALEHQAKDLAEREGLRTKNDDRLRSLRDPVNRPPMPSGKSGAAGQPAMLKTYGAQFVESQDFKDFLRFLAPSGHINENKRFDSPAVQIAGLDFKTLITGASDTSAGAMIVNQVDPLVLLGRRPLTIFDLITVGDTESDTIEYPRVTTETNNAAVVAEATATSGGSGASPESALALEKVTAVVKAISHFIPATNRALNDAGQVRTLIDNFLEHGLREKLEDQIVGGDGSGENFTGIANVSGVQAQAWATNILTTLRQARTKVRVTGRAKASAYLLHPNDWEDIDLLQDNEARYFFGGPSVLGTPRLWGLPVVECEAVTEGYGYCGDFKQVVLWNRAGATIQVSNSHSDFFIRGLVAILAELRAAMGILRPSAIVEADLTA